jgi:hypothetical protein
VLQDGRVISPAKESHEISVPSRARLVLRNAEYFLNQPLQLDGRLQAEWEASGLGRLELRAGEACEVTIGSTNLGEPPIKQAMAAGTYTAVVSCGAQPPKRQPFTITAGQTTPVTVR